VRIFLVIEGAVLTYKIPALRFYVKVVVIHVQGFQISLRSLGLLSTLKDSSASNFQIDSRESIVLQSLELLDSSSGPSTEDAPLP
jgi:hypothetical protein